MERCFKSVGMIFLSKQIACYHANKFPIFLKYFFLFLDFLKNFYDTIFFSLSEYLLFKLKKLNIVASL